MPLTDALLLDPAPFNVWIAVRTKAVVVRDEVAAVVDIRGLRPSRLMRPSSVAAFAVPMEIPVGTNHERDQMTFLSAGEVADSVLFALQSPRHVNVAELFVLPTNQPW